MKLRLMLHLRILSILFILSEFPTGTATKTLDRMNRIYRIKPLGNDLVGWRERWMAFSLSPFNSALFNPCTNAFC